ncbi:MAG: VWA domain-containing protein [Gammaproteobacteria bacterium]|nr:VWA domain-containing protein [Gammaproteobacteria bacterium]
MEFLTPLFEIEFMWPWVIAFLPLPWIVRRVVRAVPQKQTPLLAPQIINRIEHELAQEQLVNAAPSASSIPPLFVLLWLLILLAAARPIWYLTPTPFQVSGKEMMLAVDLSGSMQKQDMYLNGQDVNRLVAVKSVVSNFIQQRQGDRIGLVVFGTQAFLQSPLTYDLNTVNSLLNETEISMAGNNTAIGDAIGLTLKHLQKSNAKNAVLILLTDGSNTAGKVNPVEAAKRAEQMGLKIYTVGVGRVSSRTGLDIFLSGKSDMDIDTLKLIADITHGQFFQANDTQQLSRIYQFINQLESTDHTVHSYRLHSELYFWPLGAAFLLSLGLAFIQIQRRGQ